MGFLAWLWYYLWVAPYVLLTGVVWGLLHRKLYREFPVFLVYAVFQVAQFVVLFAMARSSWTTPKAYFTTYALVQAASTALRFGIIHEILAQAFRTYSVFDSYARPAIRWVIVGLLLTGLGLAVISKGNTGNQEWFLLSVFERTALILQTGLLIALFTFSSYLGMSWRKPVFGFALGLGIFASVGLLKAAVDAQTGTVYTAYLDYVTMSAYHASVVIWGYYLLVKERQIATLASLDGLPEHAEVESWNHELERLLR